METLASPMELCVWNWIYDTVSPQKANFLVFTHLDFVEMMDYFSLFLLVGYSNSFYSMLFTYFV